MPIQRRVKDNRINYEQVAKLILLCSQTHKSDAEANQNRFIVREGLFRRWWACHYRMMIAFTSLESSTYLVGRWLLILIIGLYSWLMKNSCSNGMRLRTLWARTDH